MGPTKESQPCGLTASSISSVAAPRKPPAPRSRRHRPPRGLRAASLDEDRLAGPGQARRTPATELDRGTVWVREPRPCCTAADNSDRASCHNAGTRRETNGATIDPASRTASQLTDLADQVPPSAPARAPAPLPPRSARRPSPHPQKGPRSSATSRATETRSTSAGSRLSLKNSTSGHIEVNLLGIDIHAIHSPWGQTIANHVIHLSRWWNPAVEDQCTDRVYRIGQDRTVHVYYPMAVHPLYGESSFDALLNALLTRKRDLSRRMLLPPVNVKQDQNWFAENLGRKDPVIVPTDIEDIDIIDPIAFEPWALGPFTSL